MLEKKGYATYVMIRLVESSFAFQYRKRTRRDSADSVKSWGQTS